MTDEEEESEVKEKEKVAEETVLEFGFLKDYSFTFKLKPRLSSPKLLLLNGETVTDNGNHQPSEATSDAVHDELINSSMNRVIHRHLDSSTFSEIRFCEHYLTKRQISAIEASYDSLTAMVTKLQNSVKPNSRLVVDPIESKAKRDVCEIEVENRSELKSKSCPEKEFLVCDRNCDDTSKVKMLDQRHLSGTKLNSHDQNVILTDKIEPKSSIIKSSVHPKNVIIELEGDHDNDQKEVEVNVTDVLSNECLSGPKVIHKKKGQNKTPVKKIAQKSLNRSPKKEKSPEFLRILRRIKAKKSLNKEKENETAKTDVESDKVKDNVVNDAKIVDKNPKIAAKKSAKSSTKKARKLSTPSRKSQKMLPLVNVNKITNYFEPKTDPPDPPGPSNRLLVDNLGSNLRSDSKSIEGSKCVDPNMIRKKRSVDLEILSSREKSGIYTDWSLDKP